MALFPLKFPSWRKRDPAGVGIGPSAASDTVDTLRRRARQRLIGTALLVLAGIFGFPLLFDSQPRPLPVEMRVEVPDRDKVAPLVVAPAATPVASAPKPVPASAPPVAAPVAPPAVASPATPTPASAPATAPANAPANAPGPAVVARAEPAPAPKPEAVPAPKPEAKPEPKPEPKAVAKVEPKPEVKPEVKAESKPPVPPKPEPKPAAAQAPAPVAAPASNPPQPVADADARFIVQIGAFADDARVRDVRARVERAGLKTYIHTIDTPDGKRTRVRVGPYATRADAEKAAERLRSIDLPGAILTL